jgi:hypothetical protein
MKYLGALRGSGLLSTLEEALGRADFEIEGYLLKPGEVVASGELRMTPEELVHAFGQPNLKLRTDDGRVLSIRFSAKKLSPASTAAHADFSGDLPIESAWGR